jgi:hypothetical protein
MYKKTVDFSMLLGYYERYSPYSVTQTPTPNITKGLKSPDFIGPNSETVTKLN